MDQNFNNELVDVGNDPNFVFENDPNFETVNTYMMSKEIL